MTARWLTSLVRARQFQEDSARQRLVTAERLADRARARVRYDAERLDLLRDAGAEDSASAFVAAAVALQAAAATHAAASEAARRASAEATDRRSDLADAAVSRRSAERLADRVEADQRARRATAAQHAQDEVAASVHRRKPPAETGP